MKSYLVVGLGLFGQSVARQLCELGAEVLVMDKNSDLVQQVAGDVTHAVVGDARDKEVLRALGAKDFECAIVAIGQSMDASLRTVAALKELGVRQIYARALDATHQSILAAMSIRRIFIPESYAARSFARKLGNNEEAELL